MEWSFNKSISYLVCFSYEFCSSSQKQNAQVVFWIGSSTHYFYIKANLSLELVIKHKH